MHAYHAYLYQVSRSGRPVPLPELLRHSLSPSDGVSVFVCVGVAPSWLFIYFLARLIELERWAGDVVVGCSEGGEDQEVEIESRTPSEPNYFQSWPTYGGGLQSTSRRPELPRIVAPEKYALVF